MRVIVLGGLGWFGRTIIAELAKLDIAAVAAARSGAAPIRCDANDADSLQAAVRPGDLVIDAAGPFHTRSTALIEAAIDVGFDVVDINDNLHYAQQVVALAPRIGAAGIRVITSASTVTAVAAAVIRHSGITAPVRVSSFLAPATRYTANRGTALSLLRIVGRPISIWRDGRLQPATGWTEPRSFPMPLPVRPFCGRLYESADAVHLPRAWPSLREVTMYVDANTRGVNTLLTLATRNASLRRLLETCVGIGTRAARRFGASAAGIGYEIEASDGSIARYALTAQQQSYLTAVTPAVLAAQAIVSGQSEPQGCVLGESYVDPARLIGRLCDSGIQFTKLL